MFKNKYPFLSNLSQTLNLNECIAPQTEGPKRTLVVFAAGAALVSHNRTNVRRKDGTDRQTPDRCFKGSFTAHEAN